MKRERGGAPLARGTSANPAERRGAAPSVPWAPAQTLEALGEMGEHPALLVVRAGARREMSGAELRQLVLGTAGALVREGVGRRTVVAIWGPNGPKWIAAGLACHYLGAIVAPLDALLSIDEAREQAIRTGAAVFLLDGPAPGDLPKGMRTIDFGALTASGTGPAPAEARPDAPIALFRTSGTTGAPKAFHLSLLNIAWNVRTLSDSGIVRQGDRVLMPLPLHHVFPWITATLTSLTVGATLILPESPTGPHIAEALRIGRPTIVAGVPRLYEAMLAGIRGRIRVRGRVAGMIYDGFLALSRRLHRHGAGPVGALLMAPVRRAVAPGLRVLVSGGAHLPAPVQQDLEALGWDVRIGYGLAETASSIAGTLTGKRAGSVGRPLPGSEVRIDASGADGVGEILVRGPVVFGGYIDNPGANAEAFTVDGFFRTGDLGRLDNDGFLYVTGRKKEVIVLSGGDNLYPEDVEREYLTDPQIGEIGVLERDGALVALIVPNMAEILNSGAANAEDAIRVALGSIARRLPSTWRLAGFALTREPLPRTRLGKLRRFRLPGLYDRARSGKAGLEVRAPTAEERAWIETPPRAAVWAILERENPGRPFDLESHMQLDFGLDSFGWMTLAVEVEQATGVRLDAADIAGIATVRDLLTLVAGKAAETARTGPDTAEIVARERAQWLAPPAWWERALGAFLHGVNAGLMPTVFGLRANGAETLPQAGPLLLCPNHVSDMDAFVLEAALPGPVRRRVHWAAARSRLFATPLQRLFARAVGAVPVDEARPLVAIDLAVEALAAGGAQVWFPEGWRSPDGMLLPFQPGIGLIVLRSGAPVVPVLIRGTLDALPTDRRLPRPAPVSVTFGAPVPAAELIAEAPPGKDQAQAIADALRARHLQLATAGGRP